MIIHDQHLHSYYSADSNQEIRPYLLKAREVGVSYFVLTDHYDYDFVDNGDLIFDCDKQFKELENLQKEFPDIKILKGVEIGYKKSELKRINELVNKYDFDLINYSVHESYHLDYYCQEIFEGRSVKEILTLYYNTIIESLEAFTNFDVVTHIDYGFKTAYKYDPSIKFSDYEDFLVIILKKVISLDKTLEINSKVQEYFPDEHLKYLLSLYKRLGGKHLTISSDGHKLRKYRYKFNHYINIIKQEGFDHLCYFVKRKRYEYKI